MYESECSMNPHMQKCWHTLHEVKCWYVLHEYFVYKEEAFAAICVNSECKYVPLPRMLSFFFSRTYSWDALRWILFFMLIIGFTVSLVNIFKLYKIVSSLNIRVSDQAGVICARFIAPSHIFYDNTFRNHFIENFNNIITNLTIHIFPNKSDPFWTEDHNCYASCCKSHPTQHFLSLIEITRKYTFIF